MKYNFHGRHGLPKLIQEEMDDVVCVCVPVPFWPRGNLGSLETGSPRATENAVDKRGLGTT